MTASMAASHELNFTFIGDIYTNTSTSINGKFINDQYVFYKPVEQNATYNNIQAVSIKGALSKLRGRIASKYKISKNSYIGLDGKIIVSYFDGATELYQVYNVHDYYGSMKYYSSTYYILLISPEIEGPWYDCPQNTSNKIKFCGTWMYLEQAKYLKSVQDHESAIWILIYENGEKEYIRQNLEILIDNNERYVEYNNAAFFCLRDKNGNEDEYFCMNGNRNSDKLYRHVYIV